MTPKKPHKAKAPSEKKGNGKKKGFHTYFTRNGVTYYAKDYGYKAWPF